LILLQLLLEEPVGWIVSDAWEQANQLWVFLLYEAVPACLQMFFLLVATYWVVKELHLDLIRRRRVARIFMLCFVAGQGLLSLLVERIGFLGQLVPFWAMYPVHNLMVGLQAVVAAVIVTSLLRRDVLAFLVREPPDEQRPSAGHGDQDREVARLRALLEEEHVYQQMGLTVAELAKLAAIPQYRLRDLIHNELGFRNFSAFLHHYRIAEVSAALEDEQQDQIPILTLALTAGYQSINPFNRAFKELKGVTPSEYRARRR
jgi:AraC-like DNA-binding protein